MKKALHLFAQLAKIDEAKREVWGCATAEMVDKEGEIFDYASSKPYFKAWSDEIAKATDGKSLGNVREMHEPSAVGKLVSMDFDDQLKQIVVGAKIVDEAAWQKCLQGVYTGFSIGGQYVKAWKDGEYVRFTANPAEISVVDNPCVPGAHFTAVKADGNVEIRKFAPKQEELPLKKDMYSVANLAALLQSLVYLQCDTAFEAEWEADGSKIPDQLKTWVKAGAAILAAMTEEEISELTASLKTIEDKLGKAGAKHSAETRAHHAAINKCMGKIAKAAAEAQDHCSALMGKDDADAAVQPAITKQVPAEPEPKIETQESNMLEPKEKETLEKASADSASSLSKTLEVEKSVNELKVAIAEQAKGQEAIAGAIGNLTKILGKMAGVDDGAAVQKVNRTAVTATLTKEQDNGAEPEFKSKSQEEIAKMSPKDREAYTLEAFKHAQANPDLIQKIPGRVSAR